MANSYLLDLLRKGMEINVIYKIRSMMRRGTPFFCLTYDYDNRAISVFPSQQEYF